MLKADMTSQTFRNGCVLDKRNIQSDYLISQSRLQKTGFISVPVIDGRVRV
jgi:hypothetical protein